jgi:hypothetical protein
LYSEPRRDPMSNQSDREPGVPVYGGHKERIPGQRHDLNKCTLHDHDLSFQPLRLTERLRNLVFDDLREALVDGDAFLMPQVISLAVPILLTRGRERSGDARAVGSPRKRGGDR